MTAGTLHMRFACRDGHLEVAAEHDGQRFVGRCIPSDTESRGALVVELVERFPGLDVAETDALLCTEAARHQTPAPRLWNDIATDPPVSWLVPGVYARGGNHVVGGGPGAGKSLLAWDIALRASHGLEFLGRTVQAHSTLVLAGEGFGGIGARLRAWQAAHPGAVPVPGHYVAALDGIPDLTRAGAADTLGGIIESTAAAHGRMPDVVVLDTLAMATPGIEENDAGAVGHVFAALAAVRRRHGCATSCLHHTRKVGNGQKSADDLNALRGSGAIGGAADVVLVASDDGEARKLTAVKSRDGENGRALRYVVQGFATGWNRDDGLPEFAPVPLPAPEPVQESEDEAEAAAVNRKLQVAHRRREAVVATVRGMGGFAPSRRSIVMRCPGRDTDVYAAIKEAVAAGEVLPDGDGFRIPS